MNRVKHDPCEAYCFVTILDRLSGPPEDIRSLADKNFKLLKSNPRHPSLRVKRIEELWSVRVGDHYRAFGFDAQGGINWFWIDTHGL